MYLLWYIFFLPHLTMATVLLKNSQWHILLDPSNLVLYIRPYNDTSFTTISTGTSLHHSVHFNNQSSTLLSWNWNSGKYIIELSLQDNDLHLTIHAKNITGPLQILNQPGGKSFGQGLILPLAEGHFIPSNHPLWNTYLLEHFNDIDTTKDLSLPLWGMQYSNYNVHWILTNPFNNQLTFKPSQHGQPGLQLSLTHHFSTLDPTAPFTAILHLSPPSPNSLLSGAKRYRQWLIEQGRFVTLKEKVENNPSAEKILGATHLYIWGGYALDYDNINDWPVFLSMVPKPLMVHGITWPDEYEHERILLDKNNVTAPYSYYAKHRMITDYNQEMNEWARRRWQNIDEFPIEKLISNYVQTYDTLRFNPAECWTEPSKERLGGGVSMKTIEKLMEANLTNLWLGLGDGWEAGLWHHPVVRTAVEEMGYLVAPYDSYQNALHGNDTEHSKWVRGYLGNRVYNNCGVVGEDGKVIKGFMGKAGHWINPKCEDLKEKMEERIVWIGNATGFNSWFLDGYGSGRVAEDFRKSGQMSQREMAGEFEKSFEFVGGLGNGMVVGSEYGNAVVGVSKGLIFAHGMQTPRIIGWEDDGDYDNEQLKEFGGWLPVEQPDLFFKEVVIKEPFKTVHFDWRYRLPLYQAVFHGSVVTSHHFLFDCLKVGNVRKENILMGMLYNVPALFHVSKETLGKRLEIILKIDRFFKPFHKWLGTMEMVGFGWLNEDRSLQQTIFEDGTRIIANFGNFSEKLKGNFSIDPFSVIAIRGDGDISGFSMAEDSIQKNSDNVKIKNKSKPPAIFSNAVIGVVCSLVLIGVGVIFMLVLYVVKYCGKSKGKLRISLKRARVRSCSNVS